MSSILSKTDVLVLCGGRGVRLGELTRCVPKPLLPIGGSPFLLRLLLQWKKEGVRRFILGVHHLAEQFQEFANQYSGALGRMEVICEKEPLGTAGGIRKMVPYARSEVMLVANGDSYVTQPLAPLLEAHERNGERFTMVGIRAEKVLGGTRQKGILKIGAKNELLGFTTPASAQEGWVNAGVYVLNRSEAFSWSEKPCSLENELLTSPKRPRVSIFKSDGVLLDIGLPECYAQFDRQLGPIENLFDKVKISWPNAGT